MGLMDSSTKLERAIERAVDPPDIYRATCCEPGCDRFAKVRGRCRRCDRRVQGGTWPMRARRYAGQTCMDGCGRPARRVSGKCKMCYLRSYNRERRRKYIFQRILGVDLELDALIRGANELHPVSFAGGEAQRCFREILIEIKQGGLCFTHPPRR